jgi:hypothetical protein
MQNYEIMKFLRIVPTKIPHNILPISQIGQNIWDIIEKSPYRASVVRALDVSWCSNEIYFDKFSSPGGTRVDSWFSLGNQSFYFCITSQ